MPTAIINEERKRPSNLVYAVDEWPPPFRLALLGTQYAVMSSIYLVLVVIVLREAHASAALAPRRLSIEPLFAWLTPLDSYGGNNPSAAF